MRVFIGQLPILVTGVLLFGQQVTNPSDSDVVTSGRNVRVANDVTGDVAVAGADVRIDSEVRGYVMSAGRNVSLRGPIGNDLWAAGETVDVTNSVGNNAMIAGRTVHLGPGASIAGNASLAGNTIRSEGRVSHDLRVAGANVTIGGDIGGTVNAKADRLSVLPGAVVRGDLVVYSPRPPEISPQAQVMGTVRHEQPPPQNRWAMWPMFWIWSFLGLFILGAAALLFAPGWPREVAGVLRVRPGASLLIGALLVFLVPIAIVLFAVTIVGIPLAVVAFGLYLALLALSGVFVAFRVGDWLLTRSHRVTVSRWAPLALGVLIVSLLISLPVVGAIVSLVVVLLGAGALFLERRSRHWHIGTAAAVNVP